MTTSARQEQGSFFHLELSMGVSDTPWMPEASSWFGTARGALRAIVDDGCGGSIRRLLLPSYYCHDVSDTLRDVLDVGFYPDGPLDAPSTLELAHDEAALVVDYFGTPHHVEVSGGTLIRDATHDPLLQHPQPRPADLVVASLRKTLPVPDGALVWSESGRTPPSAPPETEQHHRATTELLTGMVLKTAYLRGFDLAKTSFLDRLRAGESGLGASASVSGVSGLTRHLAPAMDARRWLDLRASNRRRFAEVFGEAVGGFHLLPHPAFAVLVAPHGGARDRLRDALIAADIYPAVLWDLPIPHAPERHRDLSERVLVLHVDGRYDPQQIERLADVVVKTAGQVGNLG